VAAVEKTPASRLIGAALLIPAFLVWLLALVLPTVRLVIMSFQKIQPLRKTDPEFIGMENYNAVLDHGLVSSILSGVTLAILPLLVFFMVGPLLGWAASHAEGRARRAAKAVLMLPLMAFVPAAAAFAWTMRDFPNSLVDLEHAWFQERLTLTIAVFGLVCALAVTVYSAVFRPADRPRWAAALVVSGIAVLAGIAIGIQQFGLEHITPFGKAATSDVEHLMFDEALRAMRFGAGAATGTMEFVVLAVLGLLATALIAFTGLRVSVLPRETATRPANPAATIGLMVGVLIIVAVAVAFLLPWFGGLFNPVGKGPKADFVASWVVPLLSTFFAVALAVLGGFGIGAMRPLGRFSELLLLPFAPWLFTGTGPLSVPAFYDASKSGNWDTLWALIPPLWMFAPALFLFTLLFRGQADRAAPGKFLQTYVLPVLPAAVIAVAVLALVQAQDFLWSLIMSGPDTMSAPAAFVNGAISASYRSTVDDVAYSTVTPLWLIPLVVVGAIAAQWFYADRVVISTSAPVTVNHLPE
jgi:ABC-type spermidine/putrescine transport system permease subunit II